MGCQSSVGGGGNLRALRTNIQIIFKNLWRLSKFQYLSFFIIPNVRPCERNRLGGKWLTRDWLLYPMNIQYIPIYLVHQYYNNALRKIYLLQLSWEVSRNFFDPNYKKVSIKKNISYLPISGHLLVPLQEVSSLIL